MPPFKAGKSVYQHAKNAEKNKKYTTFRHIRHLNHLTTPVLCLTFGSSTLRLTRFGARRGGCRGRRGRSRRRQAFALLPFPAAKTGRHIEGLTLGDKMFVPKEGVKVKVEEETQKRGQSPNTIAKKEEKG